MRLFILILLSINFLFIHNTHAEWKMWGTDGRDIVYYLNYNTIEIKDGYVFYWFLMNFLDPNSNGPKSTSIYLKADCNKFEVKPIKAIFFLEEIGKNKKNEFYYSSNEAWRSYNPNSTPGIMLKSICKKTKNFI